MKVKEKANSLLQLWLHVNAGDKGMQAGYFLRQTALPTCSSTEELRGWGSVSASLRDLPQRLVR